VLRQFSFAAVGILALAGCNAPTNETTAAPAPAISYVRLDPGSNAKPSNRYSEQLFEMGDQVRLAAFRNFMTQSDEQCDLVTSAVLRGNYRGTDLWRVGCSDSGEWMIAIEPDSSTKILSCDTIKRLGDDCHTVWGPSAKRPPRRF
jgi:hypothetical protein